MYYKITDKTSEKYKKLYTIRKEEIAMDERNEAKLKERFPDWNGMFVGYMGQQNMGRVTTYLALGFDNKDKVNPKEWRESKEHKGLYEPNRRTKSGKEIGKILNELESSSCLKIRRIFNATECGRFTFPYIEIGGDDNLYIYIDDKWKPSEELIEITSAEFNAALGIK